VSDASADGTLKPSRGQAGV